MKILKKVCGGVLLSCCLQSVLVGVSALPQWVWNKDVIDSNRVGNNQPTFSGQSTRFPDSADSDLTKSNIRIVDGTPRLIPSLISAVSNSIQGGNGGGGGGAFGGLFGTVLQSIPQLATQAIGGIFRPPVTLPAKDPGFGSGSSGSSGSQSSASCKCIDASSCFLPNKQEGSCQGGRVQCCSGTRTVFPDDGGSSGSLSGTRFTKNERTVTQREIRRGLLQQILKGSGSLVDDTLDLILTPYLSKDDQQKIATRVVSDE